MAIYKVQAPDGSIIELEGPDGATDAQLMQAAQAAYAQRQKTAPAVAAQTDQQPAPTPAAPMGFLESIGEMVTGSRRATTETQNLPEWTGMPELNQMSLASFKTALGTLVSNPQETVQILKSNFPGTQVRQDQKGNFIIRSSIDQREYAIPPGFAVGDIPRALAGVLAFTPAGRATTIPGAVAASAGTQAAIEATQAGTGGTFDTSEVALAGATGGAGQVLQRGVQAAAPAAKRVVQRVTGRQPTPAAQTAMPVAAQAEQVAAMPAAAVAAQAVPEQPAAQVATEAFEEVGDLVRKASGKGFGSTAAQARLADLAQVNPEAKAAAERLGMDLPFDVFSDNPQVRAAVGLTRSVAGGEAEAAWVNTVRNAITKADDVVQQFDAAFIEGRPAPGATSQRILDSLKGTQAQLSKDAGEIYQRVDDTIPKTSAVEFPKLTQTLDDLLSEVGETGLTTQEKKLYDLATDPNATYGRLLREKNLIGQAMAGKDSPYGNMDASSLKRLYAALADDQLTNVGALGGATLRQELRAANLLTAKKKALENRIVGAFGKEIDGSVATLMQSAIKSASKGDAAQFNKLLKVVPPELRKETIATALASVSSSGRAAQEGAFGFAEFAKTYRGLRANPPVYKQIVETLGKDADTVLRDLYEISRRITDARSQVITTGKANQALVESMKAEGLIGRVMQAPMAQRTATGAVSLIPGGGFVAPDIVQFMSKNTSENIKNAGKLFASDDFQRLAIEASTRQQPSKNTIKRVALSKAFTDFAKSAKLPSSLDARIQWLQSAAQTSRQMQSEVDRTNATQSQ